MKKTFNLIDQLAEPNREPPVLPIARDNVVRSSQPIFASLRLRSKSLTSRNRRGTTVVEFALVIPIFLLFIFALLEFGHALMVMNMLTSVSKEAALMGSFDGTSTAEVQQLVTDRLASTLDGVTASVSVKDASTFELSTSDASSADVASLPNLELNSAESRQLFMVHVEVPYDNVALLPTFWIRGVTLRGDSVMRRE